MSTYEGIAGLPVRIEGYELQHLSRPTSSGWDRHTALIRLHGGGEVGESEDVWYDEAETLAFIEAGPVLDLTGPRTLDAVSSRLGEPDLFPHPSQPHAVHFRRWGFEAAVLDLALRQAGMSLADALGRPVRPVNYVLSLRLGEPASAAPLRERLSAHPDMTFKLDPTPDWTDAVVADILALGRDRVRVLDFKALYESERVAMEPDADLYRRCLEAWPEAWIEDPHLTLNVRPILAPHMDRVTWDAPLRSLASVTDLAHTPRMINIKPCRFGSLRELMSVYDHCEANRIGMYGGGFFELGPARGQIQYLASLFHPEGSNDVAPRGFHWPHPGAGIPGSPLAPAARATGFAWTDADPPPADSPSASA